MRSTPPRSKGTRRCMRAQRGFSLLEVSIASAIAVVLAVQSIALVHTLVLGATATAHRVRAGASAAELQARLIVSAATAWSVFVPRADVLGSGNADGHEVDFVTQDVTRRSFWWAYAFDATRRRVTQYAYSPGGAVRAGGTYDGIDAFHASAYPVSAVTVASNPGYDPLFAGASVHDVVMPFGWTPQAPGGNGLVRVAIGGTGINRVAMLAPATAPSRFTVVLTYTPAPGL
jgi:prepilin-type N-terminal cleavage/methylation domain-containing protein